MSTWEKIEVDQKVPKGAVIDVGGYLWRVMRRGKKKGGKFPIYLEMFKPLIIRKK